MTEERLKEIETLCIARNRSGRIPSPAPEWIWEYLREIVIEMKRLRSEKETWGNEFTAVHTAKLENQSLRELLKVTEGKIVCEFGEPAHEACTCDYCKLNQRISEALK